jgi:hypothetical protein
MASNPAATLNVWRRLLEPADVIWLSGSLQSLRDQVAYTLPRRENTEKCERPGVEDLLAVHQHRELAIVAFDKLDVHVQLSLEVGRHPGGLDA